MFHVKWDVVHEIVLGTLCKYIYKQIYRPPWVNVWRHDAVLGLVEKKLNNGGSELVKREPRITGERGLLIPDLIAVTERRVCVLDVQVVSDAGVKSLAEFHRWKRDKCDNPSVILYCHSIAPIDKVMIFLPICGRLYL